MKFFSADLKEKTSTLDDLNRLIYEATQKKVELENEYEEEVNDLRVKYVAEKHAKQLHIDSLKEEVSSLESRKAEALKPLDDYKKSLEFKENELAIERTLIEKEYANIADKKSEYELLVDQVKELSTDLHDKLRKAGDKLERANSIEVAVIQREKDLILRIDLFNSRSTEKEKEIADKLEVLTTGKAVLEARERMLDDRKIKLDTEQGLINSRNETLRLAMKEIQKWQAKMQK